MALAQDFVVLILVFREDMLGAYKPVLKKLPREVLILVFREDMLGEFNLSIHGQV